MIQSVDVNDSEYGEVDSDAAEKLTHFDVSLSIEIRL